MNLTAEQRQIVAAARAIKAEARKEAKSARPKSPKADRGRERDNGFLAYLRRQPCEARGLGGCSGPIDPAHIRFNDGPDRQNPGGARKNHDRHCNPLCRTHHDEQHAGSERAFWQRVGADAYETAAGHFSRYLGGSDDQNGSQRMGTGGVDHPLGPVRRPSHRSRRPDEDPQGQWPDARQGGGDDPAAVRPDPLGGSVMRRVIERIEPLPEQREGPEVEVTARDIMGDQYGEAYTFRVRGEDRVRAIYAEAGF